MSRRDKQESDSRKRGKRSRSHSKDKSPHKNDIKKPKERKRTAIEEEVDERQSGSNESLSIEETNKLRAKLGLTPLDVTSEKPGSGGDDPSKPRNSDTDFVHAPAKNITEKKKTEKIKEKLSVAKEKRELMDKLREVASLGSGNDLSASSWIDKMRAKEKAKREAEEREKILSEMDEEFGVSKVVNNSLKANSSSINDYSSYSLQGLKVEHKAERFESGAPIILTLKDKGVLEEDDSDVLVNVNIIDDEKAEKNRENKRKMTGLGGIVVDEDEDVLMGLRMKGVLEKYDVEIDGEKKNEFVLTQGGSYSADHEIAMRRLKEELHQGRQSLEGQEMRVASEFYSPSEMDQFKKRKRKTKVQRRTLRADDLLNSVVADQAILPTKFNGSEGSIINKSRDHGNRRHGGKSTRNEDEPEEGEVDDSLKASTSKEISFKKPAVPQNNSQIETGLNPAIAALLEVQSVKDDEDDDVNEDTWTNDPLEPDDLQIELEKTLERVRRTNLANSFPQEESTMRVVKQEPLVLPRMEMNSDGDGSSGLIFDSTAEFFKQITGGLQTANQDRYDQSMLAKKENEDENKNQSLRTIKTEEGRYGRPSREKSPHESRSSHKSRGSSSSSQSKSSSSKPEEVRSSNRHNQKESSSSFSKVKTAKDEPNELRGVLDDEPELDQGLFFALCLAQKKGYVDEQREVERPVGRLVNLMAKNCVQEDIRYDDIKAKFTERDRYQGPLSEFHEKSNFKPEVKLHYVDELGRDMTPKEAFRQLSHKFHGKGSGKKKIEKRTKKIMEETLLKSSASSDTPLGTANKLNKKLERQGVPYVVLSGKNAVSKNLMK